MKLFDIHTIETAPEESKPLLQKSKDAMGMVPNLHGVMAQSPQILEAYQTIGGIAARSSLTTEQRHVVLLTINVANRCHYCVPAHTMLAKKDDVDEAVINAIREERAIEDGKLEALRQFTIKVVENRGFVDDADVDAFLGSGYSKTNLLDVILIVSYKVLSNYLNHFAETPLDEPFAKYEWGSASKTAAE
ncbi:MAG: carboxymuconolactone decarboxylase family protein [Rhodospirillales bacterium]